ncbi:MAG: nuclear transport factor 2 family protein [Pseudomonadales bacterium]|nr:nuclear transport factor 2 family protein [Pseudomonadales bacterium]MCP5183739.1 nuclear transport factor 2 family protein [Pseudomonadales bacterium]
MTNDVSSPAAVVRAFMHAMELMDFDTALQYVADDLEYTNGPNPPVRGPAGVRAELAPFFAPIEENQFVIRREAVAGPVVCIERLDRHHIPQGWFELPVTGVFEVTDGRIVYWREYFDMATIRDALTRLTAGA